MMTKLEQKQELLKKILKNWEKRGKEIAITEEVEIDQVNDQATLSAIVVLNDWKEYYEEIKEDSFVETFGDECYPEAELEIETECSDYILTASGWEFIDWQVW